MWLKNRAIRAGISIYICIVVSNLLKLKYPFFVALPSIVPVPNSVSEAIKSGRNRMVGSIIGAAIGVIFFLIKPGNAILCGVGIIIIIYFSNFIKWESSASIAGLIFISIMISMKDEHPLAYSFNGLINTLIGVLITIIINDIALSSGTLQSVTKSFKNTYNNALSLVKESIYSGTTTGFASFSKEVENLREQLELYTGRIRIRKQDPIILNKFREIMLSLEFVFDNLKIISLMCDSFILDKENCSKYNKLFHSDYTCENHTQDAASIAINFHISNILDKLLYLENLINSKEQLK